MNKGMKLCCLQAVAATGEITYSGTKFLKTGLLCQHLAACAENKTKLDLSEAEAFVHQQVDKVLSDRLSYVC